MKKTILFFAFILLMMMSASSLMAAAATPTEVATDVPTSGPTAMPTAENTVTATATVSATSELATATMTPTMTPTPVAPVLAGVEPIAYPQPAMNELTFAYNLVNSGQSAKIYVYNFSLKQVADFDGTADAGTNIVPNLDISQMAPGLYYYIVRVVEADGSITKLKTSKFIVGR